MYVAYLKYVQIIYILWSGHYIPALKIIEPVILSQSSGTRLCSTLGCPENERREDTSNIGRTQVSPAGNAGKEQLFMDYRFVVDHYVFFFIG